MQAYLLKSKENLIGTGQEKELHNSWQYQEKKFFSRRARKGTFIYLLDRQK